MSAGATCKGAAGWDARMEVQWVGVQLAEVQRVEVQQMGVQWMQVQRAKVQRAGMQ